MVLTATKRWAPTIQEQLDEDPVLWLLCESCGKLSKRILANQKCPHCPSRKIYLVEINVIEEVNSGAR